MKVLVLLSIIATASAQLSLSSQKANHMFTLVDANRDGIFSKAELGTVFRKFDQNGDHRITMHEFYNVFCEADRHLCGAAAGLFKVLDVDHTLMLKEYNLDNMYALFDANGDGEITKSEFHAFMVKELDSLSIIPFF